MLRNNLAKLMIDRGISATQLFTDTGIARSTISKISNNNTDKISSQTIDKLCNYLEVSPTEFFDFWPYEVKVKSGFINFDSLKDVQKTWKKNGVKPEPCFLLIEISRGKNITNFIEYLFVINDEYLPGFPYHEYDKETLPTAFLDEVELIRSDFNLSDMPVQFRNDLVDQVEDSLFKNFGINCFSKNNGTLETILFQ